MIVCRLIYNLKSVIQYEKVLNFPILDPTEQPHKKEIPRKRSV